MTISDAKEKLETSRLTRQYTPTLMAVVILLRGEFSGSDASQVCRALGVPDSYRHTVRALLQVPDLLMDMSA